MGLLDIFKKRKQTKENENTQKKPKVKFTGPFVNSNTISADEKSFYQPDEYYTLEAYAGTSMAEKVITFEERKKTTYPSKNGLYIAEIMLLEYWNSGNYPKPTNGYPGFWWFKYGIRDIGHTLESLENRGFLKWATKFEILKSLKVSELKDIASTLNLKVNQNKEKLIEDIKKNAKEADLPDVYFSKKYTLTELGKEELKENEYIVYMHKNKYKTRDDAPENLSFTVWDINRLLVDKDMSNWRTIVADIEQKRIGIRIADKINNNNEIYPNKIKSENVYTGEEILSYIYSIMPKVKEASKKKGDGYNEEIEGLSYKGIDDKKALYYLYISMEKKFDAPALYKETAKILRKYKLYEEELKVIENGLKNINANSSYTELIERKNKIKNIIAKNKGV